jgi:DedD protein
MTPSSAAAMSKSEDTEITLGTGKMLGLFFGLVILCAVFFGMGFSMGKNSVRSGPELLPSPSSSSTHRSGSTAKPGDSAPVASDSKTDTPQAAPDSNSSNGAASAPAASGDQSAATAIPPGTGYFVQVAAVSKQEDADALVESLKGRQYSAFIVTPSPDKFFHVQVGPFADVKEAEAMRVKLMTDGYNPILKK